MSWADDYNASIGIVPRQQPKKKDEKKKKSFLLDQISTVGGIVGGIGGGALGAAFGGVGAVPGAVGGSAALAGAGEALENLLMGESPLQKNVATEAALSGAFALPPLKVAKAALGVGKGTKAAKGATDSLGNTIKPTGKEKVARSLQDYGNDRLSSNQINLTRKDTRELGDFDSREMFDYFGKNYGLTDLDEINKLGKFTTGGTGKEDGSAILTNIVENAARSGRGVDITDIAKVADQYRPLMDTKEIKKLDEFLGRIGDQAGFAATGQGLDAGRSAANPNLADPLGALRAARNARDNEFFYKTAATPSPSQEALGNAYGSVGRELKDRTYNSQLALDGAASLSDDANAAVSDGVAALRAEAQKYAAGGNDKFAMALNRMADQALEAKSLKELDSLQSPFVNASRAAKLSTRGAGGAAENVGGLKQAAMGIVNSALGVPIRAADQKLGSALAGAGRKLENGAPAAAQSGLSPLGKAGLVGRLGVGMPTADLLTGGGTEPESLEALLSQGSGINETPQLPNGISGPLDPTTKQPMSDPRENLMKAVAMDAQQTGGENIATLMKLYEVMNPEPEPGNSRVMASQRQALAKINTANNVLDRFESMFDQIPQSDFGPAARVQGSFARAGASVGLNENAKVYGDLRQGLMAQLAKALGESGAMTEGDIQRAMTLVPDLGETPYERQSKLSELRSLLKSNRQGIADTGGL